MKQETPAGSQTRPFDSPTKDLEQQSNRTVSVLGGEVKASLEPTLLDSRGEPLNDPNLSERAASSRESNVEFKGTAQAKGQNKESLDAGKEGATRGLGEKVVDAAEHAGEGVKQAARSASSAAGHAAEGAKGILSEAREGSKDLAGSVQAAAGRAIGSGKEVTEDIKEGAKELANTAIGAAGDAKAVLQEATGDVSKVVQGATERAVKSVSSAIHQVGPSIRRANRATGAFVASNAAPISLLGFGAGWLLMSARHRSSMSQYESRERADTIASVGSDSSPTPRLREEASKIAEKATDRLHHVASDVSEVVQHVNAEARGRIAHAKERVVHQVETTRDAVSERATKLKNEAGVRLDRAKHATTHLAETSPLVLLALSLGAGIGTSMLFPSTKPEKRLMGGARDRIVGQASDTAARLGEVARKTAHDVRENLTP